MDWLVGADALWFSIPAVAGTVYFVVQFAMGQLGGDLDLDGDGTPDLADGDHGTDVRLISLQTLSAFAMGSGWMGLAALNLTEVGFGGAALIAVLSGIGAAWLLVFMLRSLLKLQSSGNVRLSQAVGQTGRVYIEVPPKNTGRGRVQVNIQGRAVELSAVQHGDEPITSRTPIRVLDADTSRNVLIVEPEA